MAVGRINEVAALTGYLPGKKILAVLTRWSQAGFHLFPEHTSKYIRHNGELFYFKHNTSVKTFICGM